jgi:putative resolvase
MTIYTQILPFIKKQIFVLGEYKHITITSLFKCQSSTPISNDQRNSLLNGDPNILASRRHSYQLQPFVSETRMKRSVSVLPPVVSAALTSLASSTKNLPTKSATSLLSRPTANQGQQRVTQKQKTPATRGGAIYCRVSSAKQKDDLQRQIDQVRETYASHTLFTDICSGLKYKRKGLSRLLERVQAGEFNEVVVAHKDRLARFGTELIEWVLNQAGTSLVILDRDQLSYAEKLTQDLMAIVHVFSCRFKGKRRYKSKHKAENGTPCGLQGSHGPNSESDHEGKI